MIYFRVAGIEQENRRDPTRQRDQFESIQGAVQVEETNAVNHEDTFIRDKQFEFATNQSLILLLLLCVICVLCYLNKLLHFARRRNVFVDSVQHLDPIGVGK